MQLRLETDELKLLADILLEQDQRKCADFVDKVLSHDLRFDGGELEQTAELLAPEKRRLKAEIAEGTRLAGKDERLRRLALLERVLERVNEACVMFCAFEAAADSVRYAEARFNECNRLP